MKSFSHINRRTHLYLGLALMPWFLLYAVSSIAFSHAPYFEERDKAKQLPNWTPRFERAYEATVPEGDLRPLGARIVAEAGLQGAWGVYRVSPTQINVYVYTFWRSTQVKYMVAERRLVAEDMRFRWDHFLTGMHAKGGFAQEGWMHDSWAVVVDIVALALMVWVASGVYLWWGVRPARTWGAAALAAGAASFAAFLYLL